MKPIIYLKFEDLIRVEFQRVSTEYKMSKNFDILLMTGRTGKGKDSHICLAGIDKLDLQAIQEFLVKKEVNIEEEEIEKIEGESEYEEEEEVEKKEEVGEERRRGQGRRKLGEVVKAKDEKEDDDEEEDEDFNPDDVEEEEEGEEEEEEEEEGN